MTGREQAGGPTGLADFVGRWRLVRQIDDRRAGAIGRMEGETLFTPVGEGLRCDETGRLTYGGTEMEARRTYLWRAVPGGVAVAFEDGREFHDFRFAPAPEASHICEPDHYRVRYDFSHWPDWSATWQVTGPRKDYLSSSRYSREG